MLLHLVSLTWTTGPPKYADVRCRGTLWNMSFQRTWVHLRIKVHPGFYLTVHPCTCLGPQGQSDEGPCGTGAAQGLPGCRFEPATPVQRSPSRREEAPLGMAGPGFVVQPWGNDCGEAAWVQNRVATAGASGAGH